MNPISTIERAGHRALQIKEPRDKAFALIQVAVSYADLEAIEKASSTLATAQGEVDAIKSASDRSQVLAEIADVHRKMGNIVEASSVMSLAGSAAESIEAPDERAIVLTELARINVSAGQEEVAFDLLNNAISAAEAIECKDRRDSMLSSISCGLLDTGHIIRGIKVSGMIEDVRDRVETMLLLADRFLDFCGGVKVSDMPPMLLQIPLATLRLALQMAKDANEPMEGTIGRIAVGYARWEDYEKSLEIIESMEGGFDKAHSLCKVVEIKPDVLNPDRVVQLVNTLKMGSHRAYVFSKVASSMFDAGLCDRAYEMLDSSVKAIEGLEDPRIKAIDLASISVKFAGMGRKERADEIHDLALKFADDVSEEERPRLLARMADMYANVGMYDQSSKVFSQRTPSTLKHLSRGT